MINIDFLKFLRSKINFWIPKTNLDFLHKLRLFELRQIKKFLPEKKNLLEIGAGTGFQAMILESWDFKVDAIDLESSNYKENKLFDIKIYNGKTFPYDENKFPIIFSSNVFEHIEDINRILNEIDRVTEKNAIIILLMPSSSWRIWTTITDLIKNWHSKKHGVHSNNFIDEIYYFSRYWWKQKLKHKNFSLCKINSNKIFYTGNTILGDYLSINIRNKLSYFLGSSCNIYILKKIV